MTSALRPDAGKVTATCHYRRRRRATHLDVWDRYRAVARKSAAGRVLEVGADVTGLTRCPRVCFLASVADDQLASLPFPAGAFDVVVSTFALCGTSDPHRALLEIRRVLRPVGRMLFLEHVRGPGAFGTVQDRAALLRRRTCRPNLEIVEELRRAGLVVRKAEWHWPRPALHAPLVHGVASPPDQQYERELRWLLGR